jgi:predicted DNA-binding transcriptional regulator YafY
MRRRRRPAAASALAAELGTSVRTIYRDIQTLAAQGFQIEGEAGVGFLLKPGSLMPPMMFTEEEMEAIVLGLRWVSQSGDKSLTTAARDARAKIHAVLPATQQLLSEHIGLLAGPRKNTGPESRSESGAELAPAMAMACRAAIRQQLRLKIKYTDGKGDRTSRVVWPVALAFFDNVRLLVAWCESRNDFRSFRTDRMDIQATLDRYPRPRRLLLAEWQQRNNIPEQL